MCFLSLNLLDIFSTIVARFSDDFNKFYLSELLFGDSSEVLNIWVEFALWYHTVRLVVWLKSNYQFIKVEIIEPQRLKSTFTTNMEFKSKAAAIYPYILYGYLL